MMSAQQLHEAMLNMPALKPPPGVQPNFTNPSNLRNDPLTISLLLISTIVVWIRLYTKIHVTKKMLLEDCKYTYPDHVSHC